MIGVITILRVGFLIYRLGSNHVGVGLFWQVFRGVLVQKLVDLGVGQSVPDFGITDNQHLSRGLLCVTRVPLMLKSHLKIYDIHYRWTQLFEVLLLFCCVSEICD